MHHLQGWGPPISGQELRHGFLRMVFQPCTLFCRIPALRWPLCPCLFLRRAETLLKAARQHSFELLQLFLQSLQLGVLGLVQRKQGIVFLGDLCVHVPKVQYPDGFYPVFWYLFLRFMALDSMPSPITPSPFFPPFQPVAQHTLRHARRRTKLPHALTRPVKRRQYPAHLFFRSLFFHTFLFLQLIFRTPPSKFEN